MERIAEKPHWVKHSLPEATIAPYTEKLRQPLMHQYSVLRSALDSRSRQNHFNRMILTIINQMDCIVGLLYAVDCHPRHTLLLT